MGRVRTQQDRRALSYFHQRCIFVTKCILERQKRNICFGIVAQTGALHNTIAERVDAYPLSSGYLDEAYNMVNHILEVSRCYVPRTTKATHISTPHIKTVWWKFLGQHRMNGLRFKLIFIRFMFPSQWHHHNCCLCCSWCELKTKLCKKNVPGREIIPSFILGLELFTFTSQARPLFRFC